MVSSYLEDAILVLVWYLQSSLLDWRYHPCIGMVFARAQALEDTILALVWYLQSYVSLSFLGIRFARA